jgi:hypothetical protein
MRDKESKHGPMRDKKSKHGPMKDKESEHELTKNHEEPGTNQGLRGTKTETIER